MRLYSKGMMAFWVFWSALSAAYGFLCYSEDAHLPAMLMYLCTFLCGVCFGVTLQVVYGRNNP